MLTADPQSRPSTRRTTPRWTAFPRPTRPKCRSGSRRSTSASFLATRRRASTAAPTRPSTQTRSLTRARTATAGGLAVVGTWFRLASLGGQELMPCRRPGSTRATDITYCPRKEDWGASFGASMRQFRSRHFELTHSSHRRRPVAIHAASPQPSRVAGAQVDLLHRRLARHLAPGNGADRVHARPPVRLFARD